MLTDAVNYIEDNLCNDISQEDIAKVCYSSLSSLQKLFRYTFNYSIKEYISKRRLTSAAKDLVDSEMTITEIAMKYQYNSPEVFTRAFSKLWGTPPSNFKSKWKFTGIFPKLIVDNQGGNIIMTGKKVDISELYDVLREKQDTYILCFDIVGLTSINEISYEVGDKAILECLRRIDDAADEDMLLFRIGSDEFTLVTGLTEACKAEELAREVLSLNGSAVSCNGRDVPVSMRVGATRLKGNSLRYSELFMNLHTAINNTREAGTDVLIEQ